MHGPTCIVWANLTAFSLQYWSIDDGEIVGKSDQPMGVSTYLLSDESFSDFRLTITVKLCLSEMHSGITLWGRAAPEQGETNSYAGHLVRHQLQLQPQLQLIVRRGHASLLTSLLTLPSLLTPSYSGRPSGDVPVELGHVRPLRPEHDLSGPRSASPPR